MRIAAGIRGTKRAQRLSLIAAIGIGAMAFTGCSAINQQSTTMVYSASDGVRLDMGQLELRNVLIVSEAAGSAGNVAGTFYNTSDTEITLTVTGDQGSQTEITVAPGTPKVLNSNADHSTLSTVTEPPGSVTTLELSTSAGETATLTVPILDGTLAEYKELLPTAAASDSAL
ncbi:hypothetical protein ART_3318 [Arthrobacter sp. PAMC 25486]|uniref:hypothetical protein n=1 Tax=Arthrobacter sp. PAMC 25486 TaxID=1494608 RepID=UPI00053637D3|nr:hypothetical protein [Arthrobacter sp. PAMC 25486]AIY02917.1 hypothetical protein ART_3318 [Arthrobacter sp. PAMC 25486]